MNVQKVKEKPEEIIRAEQLSDKGKLDEALTLLNNYEQKIGHTLHEIVLCHLLKCKLLFQQGKYEDVVKLAEQTYKESLGLGQNLLSIDILLIMANALDWLDQTDKAQDIVKQGEELLKTLTQELPAEYKQREAYIAFLKAAFYSNIGEVELTLKHLEYSLVLREELGIKHEIAESLGVMAWVLIHFKGELNRALKYAERGLALAKESTKKYYIAFNFNVLAIVYSLQGELDRSIKFHEQSLELFKVLNNKNKIALVLYHLSSRYKLRGELERALEYMEQSMALYRELGDLKEVALNYDSFVEILINRGDIERAQISLHDLEQINNQLNDKQINLMYLFVKALVLKTSSRAINRGKAEGILKQLLESEHLSYVRRFGALLSLCELLLTELRINNDPEVLNELNQFIGQLLEIAEKSHSYWILCETYLIQAKLSLLTFNIKQAQRFLTQAQQIAERFGLTQLATKIASENEDLLKKLDLWEKLKEENAPISDRMELARLDEKIVRMIQKRPELTAHLTEEKVVISKEIKICLVCRGEVFGFSYICKCGVNYCENCARALTNLENVCWACETQIDYSKPVKPFKEEEEKVKAEEKPKKK